MANMKFKKWQNGREKMTSDKWHTRRSWLSRKNNCDSSSISSSDGAFGTDLGHTPPLDFLVCGLNFS
jgi:hypothetical protein